MENLFKALLIGAILYILGAFVAGSLDCTTWWIAGKLGLLIAFGFCFVLLEDLE